MARTHSGERHPEIPTTAIRGAATVSVLRQPGPDLYVNHARVNAATGMLTTDCLAESPCFARCTRRWDTSMCITKCAQDWAATNALTTATLEARHFTALRTRSPVSGSMFRGIR